MRTLAFLAGTGMLLAQAATAQTAIYRDGALSIPAGAVVQDDGKALYYTDIVLEAEADGQFRVAQADAKPLVAVESVEALILESFPVQVRIAVEGYKSVPCVELLPPAISRKDNTFTVALAESELGPAQSCIAIIDPFEISIPLDVVGLEAGDYTVIVNGVETEFTLDIDNTPLQ